LGVRSDFRSHAEITPSISLKQTEEIVEVRRDWYQTPTTVIISLFAKKADKTKTIVTFEENHVSAHRPLIKPEKLKSQSRNVLTSSSSIVSDTKNDTTAHPLRSLN
jgi:hypothetical protein